MKEKTVEVMNEREKRMMDILLELGWDKNRAKCAIFFIDHNNARSSHIEQFMNMRQPEVSLGLNRLVEDGVIVRKMEKKERYQGRGRRRFYYSRNMSKEELLEYFRTFAENKIKRIEDTLKRAKQMRVKFKK